MKDPTLSFGSFFTYIYLDIFLHNLTSLLTIFVSRSCFKINQLDDTIGSKLPKSMKGRFS